MKVIFGLVIFLLVMFLASSMVATIAAQKEIDSLRRQLSEERMKRGDLAIERYDLEKELVETKAQLDSLVDANVELRAKLSKLSFGRASQRSGELEDSRNESSNAQKLKHSSRPN